MCMIRESYRAQSSGLASFEDIFPADATEEVERLILASRAPATLRAYSSDWRGFVNWCSDLGRSSMPASAPTVAMFVAALVKTHKPASIGRKIASIAVAHKSAGHESPTQNPMVRAALQGARRTLGTTQSKKVAVRVKHIRMLAASSGDRTIDIRNLALLVVTYAAAMRRSEIVSLDICDVRFLDEGILLHLSRSKTDQEGAGIDIAIHYGSMPSTCPVRLLRKWLDCLPDQSGPLFRPVTKAGKIQNDRLSAQAVARIIQQIAPTMGLNPDKVGGHSLRSGFVTDAFASGVPQAVIAKHSRHRSNVIAGYFREADAFRQNPTGLVGL